MSFCINILEEGCGCGGGSFEVRRWPFRFVIKWPKKCHSLNVLFSEELWFHIQTKEDVLRNSIHLFISHSSHIVTSSKRQHPNLKIPFFFKNTIFYNRFLQGKNLKVTKTTAKKHRDVYGNFCAGCYFITSSC